MKLGSRAIRLFSGILAATLIMSGPGLGSSLAAAPPEAARDRVFDLEIGTGFVLGIEEDTTIDDTFHVTISGAYEMNDSIDFEFGAGWSPGEAPDSTGLEENNDLYNIGAGFRWYPNSEPDEVIRFFMNMGLYVFTDLKGEGSDPVGVQAGPGMRIRLGSGSGVLLELPLWFSVSGQTNTLLSPSLTWFYSF